MAGVPAGTPAVRCKPHRSGEGTAGWLAPGQRAAHRLHHRHAGGAHAAQVVHAAWTSREGHTWLACAHAACACTPSMAAPPRCNTAACMQHGSNHAAGSRPSKPPAHRTNGSPPATQNCVLPGRQCTLLSSRRPRWLRQASRRRAPPAGSRRSKCRTSPSAGGAGGAAHSLGSGAAAALCPPATMLCGAVAWPACPHPSRPQPTLAAGEEAGGGVGLQRQLVGPAAVAGQAARLHRRAARPRWDVGHPHQAVSRAADHRAVARVRHDARLRRPGDARSR